MRGIDEAQLHGLMVTLLPPDLRALLERAVAVGRKVGVRPYLVGGLVRDLLLGRVSRTGEVDLMVEGVAAELAEQLAAEWAAPVTLYPQFGTATIRLPWREVPAMAASGAGTRAGQVELSLDITTARREHYPYPGALPVVEPGADVTTDLWRRDYTVNAMAIALDAGDRGRLIDPYGGVDDLVAGRLSVLHATSFEDDPTRLVRGVRLAGRLWLRFGVETASLVGRAVERGSLRTVSGERRWHELRLLLEEEQPSLALALARSLGLLSEIDPALHWDEWLAERMVRPVPWHSAAQRTHIRLVLLAYRWSSATIAGFCARLRPDGQVCEVLEAVPTWHERRAALVAASEGSVVVRLLEDLPEAVLAAARLAEDEPDLRRKLDWYVLELRQRRPCLGGMALRELGVRPGPIYRELLASLRAAVLDGRLPDEAAEWAYLRELISRIDGGAADAGADASPRT